MGTLTLKIIIYVAMKTLSVLPMVLALSSAMPQLQQQLQQPFYAIRAYNFAPPLNGAYNFDFETENDIKQRQEGVASNIDGAVVVQGSYSHPLGDGSGNIVEVRYVADENGYRAESPYLPVGPAPPQHALDLIRKAQEEDAQGIFFDEFGFQV